MKLLYQDAECEMVELMKPLSLFLNKNFASVLCPSVFPSVFPFVCPSVCPKFWKTKIAVFGKGRSSNDIIRIHWVTMKYLHLLNPFSLWILGLFRYFVQNFSHLISSIHIPCISVRLIVPSIHPVSCENVQCLCLLIFTLWTSIVSSNSYTSILFINCDFKFFCLSVHSYGPSYVCPSIRLFEFPSISHKSPIMIPS